MGRSYRDLLVWQKSMKFVQEVYAASATFPREEMYGLTSQVRRAAVSIPSSIAEGHGRRSQREFSQFLRISRGSIMEVETQLQIAASLGFISERHSDQLLKQSEELGKMLDGLSSSIKV